MRTSSSFRSSTECRPAWVDSMTIAGQIGLSRATFCAWLCTAIRRRRFSFSLKEEGFAKPEPRCAWQKVPFGDGAKSRPSEKRSQGAPFHVDARRRLEKMGLELSFDKPPPEAALPILKEVQEHAVAAFRAVGIEGTEGTIKGWPVVHLANLPGGTIEESGVRTAYVPMMSDLLGHPALYNRASRTVLLDYHGLFFGLSTDYALEADHEADHEAGHARHWERMHATDPSNPYANQTHFGRGSSQGGDEVLQQGRSADYSAGKLEAAMGKSPAQIAASPADTGALFRGHEALTFRLQQINYLEKHIDIIGRLLRFVSRSPEGLQTLLQQQRDSEVVSLRMGDSGAGIELPRFLFTADGDVTPAAVVGALEFQLRQLEADLAAANSRLSLATEREIRRQKLAKRVETVLRAKTSPKRKRRR